MTLVGSVLGNRYEILEEIGSGGMANVYKAHCNVLNRFVAIKVLRSDLQDDEEFVRRFKVEAQAAASLSHPNIVSIYDVGNSDGVQYIVMEYVNGITLKHYIDRKGKLPWREAVGYAMQICRALEAAHAHHIIHRDVKPQNIMMTEDGTLKVTDFGIAHASSQSTVTIGSNAIGSVHYLSPEQARGGYTDERSDIYSLGIVLYEMLTGRVPFDNDSPVAIAIQHLQEKPTPPREYNITIPMALENCILKAISKEQSLRYRTAGDMLADLERLLNDPQLQHTEKPPHEEEDPIAETQKLPNYKKRGTPPPQPEPEPVPEPEPEPEEEADTTEEKEELPVHKPNRKAAKGKVELDKKKERRVVILAVIAAAIVIGLMGFAFFSLSGLGSVFSPKNGVEIPDLVDKNIDDAREEYHDSRFNIVEEEAVSSTKEKGVILSQTPKGKTKVSVKDEKEEIVIKVTVSNGSGKLTLKDYTNYTDVREAEIELKRLGLKTRVVQEYSDSVPIDAIIRQSPPSGSDMSENEVVTLYVSKGPDSSKKDEEKDDEEENPSETSSPGNDEEQEGTPAVSVPGNQTPSTPSSPSTPSTPETPKKSAFLTIHGPKDTDSAQVEVRANGKTLFNKQMANGSSEMIKVEGSASSAEVEILYDGVTVQRQTITLN